MNVRRFPRFVRHERYLDSAYERRTHRWRRKWCGPKPRGGWPRRYEELQHATQFWTKTMGRLSWRWL